MAPFGKDGRQAGHHPAQEIEQERERLEEENRRAGPPRAVLESIAEAVRVHDSEGRVLLNPPRNASSISPER